MPHPRDKSKRIATACGVTAALLLWAASGIAQAAGIQGVPGVRLHITSDQGIDVTLDEVALGCAGYEASSGFRGYCRGYDYDLDGKASLDLLMNFLTDPRVQLNLSLTNSAATPQTFTFTSQLPTGPFGPSNVMGGSVAGSITDSGGLAGALASASPGSAIYSALIDGVVVETLHAAPFSVAVPASDPFGSANIPSLAFGQPIPSKPAPPVASDIGIQLKFVLSPGDQIALTSVFVVDLVQAPEARGGSPAGHLRVGCAAPAPLLLSGRIRG